MAETAVTLDDKYTLESGRVFMNGMQALVRLPMIQRQRDLAGEDTGTDIVLAQRHVRAILFGTAGGNDDGSGAGLQGGAELGPGPILELDAGRRGLGRSTRAQQ